MAASGDDYDRLLGVWRLVSAQVQNEDTGEVRDLHGPDPRGFAIFSPERRVSIIITASRRNPPSSDAEAAALFRGISAYTGRFRIEANKVLTEVDAAWPSCMGEHPAAPVLRAGGGQADAPDRATRPSILPRLAAPRDRRLDARPMRP